MNNIVSDDFFNQFVKVGSLFLNTQINQNFSIVSIDDEKVTCRILAKLKRGQSKKPVEFTLTRTLFKDYMSLKNKDTIPTFVKVR
jgi:ERCC4-type nuclease